MSISFRAAKGGALAVALAGLMLAGAGQATAASEGATISDSASVSIPGTGVVIQANTWNCNFYSDKCSFATSSKALKSGSAYKVETIKNTATVTANGWGATISVSPSATQVSKETARIAWTNTNTWISDISGIADPSGAFSTSITTCSDAYAFKSGSKAWSSACT
ncbi:hypothetical protein [Streptomyces sp. CC228A]|uniref:hypothetical protein n=1 Tax=Streptomyces sp. CC228A TaxID=2898186 RepID=UPI001F22C596|nr:hypothetical protein [Streptomyces sp. CC228A]